MYQSHADSEHARSTLDGYRTSLQDLLAQGDDVMEALEKSMHDPFELANYQLANELRSFHNLGSRIVHGIARIAESDLAEAPAEVLSCP